MRFPRIACRLAGLLVTCAAVSPAQQISYEIAVIVGDAYLESTINEVLNVAVNDDGEWLVHARLGNERRGSHRDVPLCVERRDIRFFHVSPGTVRIEVTVHNDGATRSHRHPLVLQAASFGAFLPWSPLARLTVPSIEPFASRVVRHDAPVASLPPSFDFDGLPPGARSWPVSSSPRRRVPPECRTAIAAGDADGRRRRPRRPAHELTIGGLRARIMLEMLAPEAAPHLDL